LRRGAPAIPPAVRADLATGRRWLPRRCSRVRPKPWTRKAVELALGGDPAALRLCLDRLIAPHRERLVAFALPRMREPADLAAAMEAMYAAVAQGVLAPAEAAELAKVVDTFAKAIEMRDFNSRLTALEKEYAEEA
jgi:hypothetical protein